MKKLVFVGGGALLAIAVAFGGAACGDGSTSSKTVTAPKTTTGAKSTPTVSTAMKEAAILIDGAWARSSPAIATPAAGMATPAMSAASDRGAAYMVIKNSGATADALIGATSDIAAKVEVHETKLEGDTMTMSPVARVEVPAKGQLELKPGGYHIMFVGLKAPLKVGTKIILNLTFEKAGTIPVQAEVREQ
ncbi:MAG: copper chaperone PCu(A)C [Chloroflexi bacterium]|nr:copper chaperone PCu(A)C [Chloroflexota bacterium]